MSGRVGYIYKLKVPCLENPAGTQGICFYDYGTGFQVIFPNGQYDGFDAMNGTAPGGNTEQTEADYFLEYVGFDPIAADYKFTNVIQVTRDFRADKWFKFNRKSKEEH